MCFSATASFTASITLSTIGVATIKKTSSKHELLLSLFPLVFATQQFIEGVIWLSLVHPSLNLFALFLTNSFLFFATLLWPIYCPLSTYLIEKQPLKRYIMLGLAGIGFLLGIYLFLFVLNHKIYPTNFSGHLLYDLTSIPNYNKLIYFYLLITTSSFVISSNSLVQLFGLFAIASFWIANTFYETTFVSVWCFFAAILSAWLYVVFSASNQQHDKSSFLLNK